MDLSSLFIMLWDSVEKFNKEKFKFLFIFVAEFVSEKNVSLIQRK